MADQSGAESKPAEGAASEPRYGGYTRFELELEVRIFNSSPSLTNSSQFVQCLANPLYLNDLASHQKLLDDPAFIAYVEYLSYFAKPEYARYLT